MSQDRKRILEMVQEGKLSAQEAMVLLDALNDDQPAAQNNQPSSEILEKKQEQEQSTGGHYQKEKEPSAEDSFYGQLENAGEKIFDFVNTAFKKIRDIDLQFTQSVEIEHVFQQTAEEIDNIDIDVANGPVRLIPWEQEEVRIECQAKIYRADDREEGRAYFLDNTIFSLKNGLLIFGTESKWMRVETTVYVPKQQYKKTTVRIFTGELTVEKLQTEQLSVKTTNGKVDLSDISGERISVDTVNGQIKATQSKVDKLEAETVNGTVDVSGHYRKAELRSFNGNIICTLQDTETNIVDAKAVTGNIHVYFPDASSIDGEIKSNLGSYKLELEGIDVMHERKDVIQRQLKFKRTGSDDRVIHLLADTKTGSVFVRKAD